MRRDDRRRFDGSHHAHTSVALSIPSETSDGVGNFLPTRVSRARGHDEHHRTTARKHETCGCKKIRTERLRIRREILPVAEIRVPLRRIGEERIVVLLDRRRIRRGCGRWNGARRAGIRKARRRDSDHRRGWLRQRWRTKARLRMDGRGEERRNSHKYKTRFHFASVSPRSIMRDARGGNVSECPSPMHS